MNLSDKFKAIRAVVLDVDGVLTDGRVGYDGEKGEMKFFHIRDGHWIRMTLRTGVLVGMLSGRESEANRRRASELGMSFCLERCHDKLAVFEMLLTEKNLKPEECLYIGDDVIDMPVMARVGIAAAVADGMPELDEVAAFRTRLPGGHGAVAEVLRQLMTEQGTLPGELERYRR